MTKIERLLIPGPAGQLDALLERRADASPRLAVVVCHPHPLFGGTMHNKVVFRLAKAALELGGSVLRFNFRGVGKSEGEYDDGVGERADAQAALDFLLERFPGAPAVMMGFSFGSWVGLAVGAADERVRALVGLGVPVASADLSFLAPSAKPKLIVQGTRDQYGPREQVESLYQTLRAPKQIHWVEDADHFFTGHLEEVQAAVRQFLRSLLMADSQQA